MAGHRLATKALAYSQDQVGQGAACTTVIRGVEGSAGAERKSRPDEGLWPLHRKTGQPLDALIERTVGDYIDFLQRTLVDHQLLSITIQGIPAPGYAFEDDKDPGDIPGFVAMIRAVNDCLRAKTLAAGFNFLDVHAATVGADGRGNGRWHLDGYHLSPAFYRQAQDWLRLPN